jgi:hypothetical protein
VKRQNLLHLPWRAIVRGYFDERAHAFKLDFDEASGEFVTRPIVHGFAQQIPSKAKSEVLPNVPRRKRAKALPRVAAKEPENTGVREVMVAPHQI